MADSLAGLALGAGSGTRMRPLSLERPKVLLPVADRPLVDHALDRLAEVTADVAANAHHTQRDLIDHLSGRVRVSVEDGDALGTAGALALLRGWIDGRPTVVVNGDTWCPGGLDRLVDGWGGTTIRVLVPGGGPFHPRAAVVGALMPWSAVEPLVAEPTGLWEVSWRAALDDGRLEVVGHDGPWVDCATPADLLTANLAAGGGSVIGAGAVVEGTVVDSVVFAGARVGPTEALVRAIRTDRGRTVLIRR